MCLREGTARRPLLRLQARLQGADHLFRSRGVPQLLATLGLPETTTPALVRRNAFTDGLDLNALIGREFTVQGVRFLGVAECSPCHWMDTVLAPGGGFLKGRGGLRCKILSDGVLRAGEDCGSGIADCGSEKRAFGFSETSGCAGDGIESAIRNPRSAIAFRRCRPRGGGSTRMGEDKAFLTVEGESLVARQARLLREAGCGRVLISGRRGVDYPALRGRLRRARS